MITIYGIFRGDICEYVGQTIDLLKRARNHSNKIRRPFYIRALKRVHLDQAEFWEGFFIQKFKSIGQARRNKVTVGSWRGGAEYDVENMICDVPLSIYVPKDGGPKIKSFRRIRTTIYHRRELAFAPR